MATAASSFSMVVAPRPVVRVEGDAGGHAASLEPEDRLAVTLPRRPHAAPAEYAAVAVHEEVRMRRVHGRAPGEVRPRRRRHAQPVRQRLQLAAAAFLADRAEVVALDEQELDNAPTVIGELFRFGLDNHPLGRRHRAGVGHLPVDLHGADAAVSGGGQVLVVTQAGDVYPCRVRGFQDGLPFPRLDVPAIQDKGERFHPTPP